LTWTFNTTQYCARWNKNADVLHFNVFGIYLMM